MRIVAYRSAPLKVSVWLTLRPHERHPGLAASLQSVSLTGVGSGRVGNVIKERSERVIVPLSKLIGQLSAYFGVLDIFERVPFRAGDPPRPVQATGRFKCGSVRVAIFDYQTVLPLPRARLR